jgi:N-carbamoyl-L-amino-acid hydrolase
MSMNIADLRINSERLRTDFDELAEIGATVAGGISRLALSNEDLEARTWLANRIEESGLAVRDDDAGNLSGVLFCPKRSAKTLIMGSHLDSVPNGGKYDGAVGVLAALECLRAIQEADIKLPMHLEAMNFTDEEGAWQGLFGSMGLTGMLTPAHINDANEDHGAFRAALFRAGIRPGDVHRARRVPATVAGYLELHIEQGYRLERANVEIGVVTAIVGRTTYYVTFFGEAAHAGTTALADRRDALLGASQFIMQAHRVMPEQFAEGGFNCGNAEVRPGAFNIVPEEVRLTIEIRHASVEVLAEMESALIKLAQECANPHHLMVNFKRKVHRAPAQTDAHVMEAIEHACEVVGASHTRLVSYAGHDAQMMSGFTPTGMIFIPSVGGISHNPREFSRWEDVERGANVLLHTALTLVLGSS